MRIKGGVQPHCPTVQKGAVLLNACTDMTVWHGSCGQQLKLDDEIQTLSNEASMVHDYAGFLRNGLGLSHQHWVHLATRERANLVTARVMGSVEYMRGLIQRFVPQGPTDETYVTAMDTSDDGNNDGMPSSRQQQHLQVPNQFLEWLVFSRQSSWDAWSAKSFGTQLQSNESFWVFWRRLEDQLEATLGRDAVEKLQNYFQS